MLNRLTKIGAAAAALTAITVFLGVTFGWEWPPFPLRADVDKKFEVVDEQFDVAADERRKVHIEALKSRAQFQQQLLDQTYGTIDAYEAKDKAPPSRVKRRATEQQRQLDETRSLIKKLER